MKSVCFIFFMFSCVLLKSQDTIFVKFKEPLLVKVLEISKNEVSYKMFYNPDGIIYKINNEQIEKIVYENGKMESKFQLLQKTTAVNSQTVTSNYFMIKDKQIFHDNHSITHKEAFKLMMKRDVQQNSDELNEALLNVESKRNGQIIFTLLGPICGVGSLYIARRNYYGPNDLPKVKAILLSGLGLCITSEVIAIVYRSLKNKHIRKAALSYNNDLINR